MRSIYFILGVALGFMIVAALLYLLLWPVKIQPAAWRPPKMPAAVGVYQENDLLSGIERLAEGYLGSESVAVDGDGFIYTGIADGRILRISADGKIVEALAQAREPLGMKLDRAGNLVVADATLGLISVDREGEITLLTDQVEGTPILFADDLTIASDGEIYFSEASTRFTNPETNADIFEHRPNGRLLVYEPATKETRILKDQLYFPNGMALGPGEAFILFTETSMYRVSRLWLEGDKAGEVEVFIDNLPGFPDNITFNGVDTYWVALASGPRQRSSLDALLPHPFLRKMLWRLPFLVNMKTKGHGYILGLSLDGQVLQTLQDPSGEVCANTTSAIEVDGFLYVGSYSGNGIGRIAVP